MSITRCGRGTILALAGLVIGRVMYLNIDHTTQRLRGRLFDNPDDEGHKYIKSLKPGEFHAAQVTEQDGRVLFKGHVRIVLCRTNLRHDAAVSVSFIFQGVQ